MLKKAINVVPNAKVPNAKVPGGQSVGAPRGPSVGVPRGAQRGARGADLRE